MCCCCCCCCQVASQASVGKIRWLILLLARLQMTWTKGLFIWAGLTRNVGFICFRNLIHMGTTWTWRDLAFPSSDERTYTRKNAQVVTNLKQTCSNAVPTTCQQDVFALLVPSLLTSYERLVDNLLQGCLAEQTCYKSFQHLVIVLQFNKLWTTCVFLRV
jgi:hypothetical protein